MQQDNGGTLAAHFMPDGHARNLDVPSLEALDGRHYAFGHGFLLPDKDGSAAE